MNLMASIAMFLHPLFSQRDSVSASNTDGALHRNITGFVQSTPLFEDLEGKCTTDPTSQHSNADNFNPRGELPPNARCMALQFGQDVCEFPNHQVRISSLSQRKKKRLGRNQVNCMRTFFAVIEEGTGTAKRTEECLLRMHGQSNG